MTHLRIVLVGLSFLLGIITHAEEPAGNFSKQYDEKLMERGIAKAKKTYMDFVAALAKKSPTAEGFAIKKPFPAGDSFEHMWLSDVTWDGKVFKATVNNDPVETKAVKFGQRVTVKPDELSDWMYIDDGVLKGGNTIRVFCAGMKPKEKKEFEDAMPFKIPAVDF